ncbi:hypothetical protein M8J77_000310 [Diaphorina citri]|nr:hypothetical protein M8J77_000310 [Diaphorina citri]
MTPTPMSVQQKVAKYVGLREKYFNSIKATYNISLDVSKRKEFLARAGKVDLTFDSYESTQVELISLNAQISEENAADRADTIASQEECEKMYYAIVAAREELTPPSTAAPPTVPAPVDSKPRIPKINIEPFTGAIENFSSFKSLFDTLIHQSNLSDIEKFSYLLSLLKGKALNLIKTFDFNEANYRRAYDKLCSEYTNQRLVATHFLNKVLSFKPSGAETPAALRQFLDGYYVDAESIRDLGMADLADFIFLHIALKNIPVETRRMFEHEHIENEHIPTLRDLMVYVKNRLSILEMVPADQRKQPSISTTATRSYMSMATTSQDSDRTWSPGKSHNTCPQCGNAHLLHQCAEFLKLSPYQRKDAVFKAKLCTACLGPHRLAQCKSTYSCRVCHNKAHHTTLHVPAKTNFENSKPIAQTSSNEHQALTCQQSSTTILLGTATARAQCASGFWHNVRLVIDPGSMVNFVTSSLAQTLQLPRSSSNTNITGLGLTPVKTVQSVIKFNLAPISPCSPPIELNATIIPTISAEIPATPVPPHIASQFQNLADHSIFVKPSKVDILLGAAHLSKILLPGQAIVPGQPSCWPTIFGNILLGEIPGSDTAPSHQSLFINSQDDILSNQLKQFWEIEEAVPQKILSPEDKACEKHFLETYQRNQCGQFIIRLPFKDYPPDLGSTRETAIRQFHNLENRLAKNEEIKAMYHANLQGYIDQEQLEVADTASNYILPHHAVVKESSSHPLRIVFNASQVSTNKKSLNETMFVGPKLQQDVGDVILRFRLHAVALCTDIRQMYRCVILHPDDRKYQHIFWRFNKSEPVQEWELKRLTFGFTPASYIAQKCLQILAESEKEKFPTASQVLLDGCYVDDIVTGAATPEEAIELRHNITALLRSGGFELKKFSSSSPDVLADIPLEDQEHSLALHDPGLKVLGLSWNPALDQFQYNIKIQKTATVTKRTLLSHVASIFDINGYLAHLVIFLKILIQKLWIAKGNWDDQVPPHVMDDWKKFVDELPCLENLHIPRYISNNEVTSFELIAFCDASSAAMSAVIYLYVSCSDGTILVNLLRAKSKVAPLKTLSIPRLELSAAHLLAKLIKGLDKFIKSRKIESVTCFSDSTTALAWIQTPPYRLKTFVANRVATISETVSPSQWRYVPTDQNPADLASRGLTPAQVISQYDFWYHGPTFLQNDRSTWPSTPALPSTAELPELKPNVVLAAQPAVVPELISVIEKYSSLTKVQYVIAWILRFVNNCRCPKENRKYGFLSPAEIDKAMLVCVKTTQQFYFADLIAELKREKPILGPIKNLSPFPSDGTLMVGGRLRNAPIPAASRHPMLLSAKCHLAKLIINHLHLYSLHGGARLIQSLLQRQYWIVGARNLIKKCIFSCLKCYKLSATVQPPYMGDIPLSRFAQGRCFINVAIDFAGPYLLKSGPRRNSPIVKSYLVVFVCMSVKAVHLELANSLTTESCLAALDRFIARRGKPNRIYSDQGTNFKASARHLSEVQQYLKIASPCINEHLASRGIKWNFHPPGAPNFSGLAEAGVKSAKHHLTRLLDGRPLYQEELCTLLCEVEACLNSRPLGFISTLPDDGFDYLTPGHFLVGAPLLARPEYDVADESITPLRRWKLLTRINQNLWRRWSNEYLHTQIQRLKWQKTGTNLKVGDPVFVIGENVPPRDWPLSRVVSVTHGADGVVRVAQVQGRHGLLTRPVSKLCPLPILH